MAHLDPRRSGDITASDVPAICGESPWQTKASVGDKKIYKLQSPDTEATLHGKRFEPVAIARFCRETGATVEYPGYINHSTIKWLGGTVDGIATYPNGHRVVIEVKCPISRKIKDEVPMHYEGQLQTYMEILDMTHCIFIQYKPGGPRSAEQFSITDVPRDPDYIRLRLPLLRRFWEEFTVRAAFVNRVVTAVKRVLKTKGGSFCLIPAKVYAISLRIHLFKSRPAELLSRTRIFIEPPPQRPIPISQNRWPRHDGHCHIVV